MPRLTRHAAVAALLLLVAPVACDTAAAHGHLVPQLDVTTPVRKTVELEHEYVAQIRAIQHVELRALERGYLEEIFVDEGQLVKEGELMFQIMPRLLQAEVKKEAAEAKRAEIELANTKMLADKDIVSPNELALARVNFSRAKAELELAKAHRGLTEIHAPFTGTMGRFQARLGSLLDEGDLLTSLSDTSTVWVYFNVSEREYLDFVAQGTGIGTPVRLKLANGALFEELGTIETIEADFDNETGTIAFRAAFPNPDRVLRHGQTGTVVLTQRIDSALLVPQKATFDILDRKFVFTVDEHGEVTSRPIQVAAELPHVFVVSNGLTTEDVFLLEGLRKVNDGAHVDGNHVPPEEAFSRLDVPAE